MPKITFEDQHFELAPRETVLDCLLRHEKVIPHSCKSGICQSCKLKAPGEDIPPMAQMGLDEREKSEGCFLSCKCIPNADFAIGSAAALHQLTIESKEQLNDSAILLRVNKVAELQYKPGQFLTVIRQEDGLARSYSVASSSTLPYLDFHISILPDGRMSQWLNGLNSGDPLTVSDGSGFCYYSENLAEMDLLLVATGTGLAPLWAVIHDALEHKHNAEIRIFHGGADVSRLYYQNELRALAAANDNVTYYPCVKEKSGEDNLYEGELSELVMSNCSTFNNSSAAFLCGNPEMVVSLKKKLYLAGMDLKNIFSDPFVISKDSANL